jgi:hypothetical protein
MCKDSVLLTIDGRVLETQRFSATHVFHTRENRWTRFRDTTTRWKDSVILTYFIRERIDGRVLETQPLCVKIQCYSR